MAKAADIVGPITLTVLVRKNSLCASCWFMRVRSLKWFRPSGVTGDQQGSVRGDAGDDRGDEEEQEPSSLREGAIRGIHLQQLCPREHDPSRPEQQPALQGPSSGRRLCLCESAMVFITKPHTSCQTETRLSHETLRNAFSGCLTVGCTETTMLQNQ